jgi:ABC-2 type transport system ATP-binding protein
MKYAIKCQQVSKIYDDQYVLNKIDLQIPEHRIVGVLGANGAGKSTLFRLLMDLLQPDLGQMRVLGEKPGWKINRQIAYLPDRARWYPEHTIKQAFQFAVRLLPGFKLEKAYRLAEEMELGLKQSVSGLSRGQEARLMLILCLARDVPLLILDEPFSGIDVISREQIINGMIEQFEDRQQTILISTHEILEIEGLLDFAVFLHKGKVKLAGEVEAIRREQGSLYDILKSVHRRG